MTGGEDGPPRPAGLPPGYDEDDPYDDEAIPSLPDWWRQNVETFREHGMRPYRPPRFADGTLVPVLVGDLEAELGVTVAVVARDPEVGDEWELRVNDEHVLDLPRERTGDGYTLYDVDPGRFERAVRSYAEDRT